MQANHFSYTHLLRQRALVAAFALALVVVIFWVGIDLVLSAKKTTISPQIKKLIEPLNPQLNLAVVERLELYHSISPEEARQSVRTLFDEAEASAGADLNKSSNIAEDASSSAEFASEPPVPSSEQDQATGETLFNQAVVSIPQSAPAPTPTPTP